MVEAVAVVEVGAIGNENGDVGLGVQCHPRGHHLPSFPTSLWGEASGGTSLASLTLYRAR